MCASEGPEPGRSPNPYRTTRIGQVALPRQARSELVLLFAAFLCLRLMSVWWFEPLYSEAGGFFFPYAYLARLGRLPFFDFWLEYPPVLAYLLVGLRVLSDGLCGASSIALQRACFVRTVQVSSILWETLGLAILYGMARFSRGHREGARACWIYLALFSTAFVSLSYVDSFPVALMLGGLALAVYSRVIWASVVLAVGFMTKVFPIGIFPVVWKTDGRWRWRLLTAGVFVLFATYCVAPFLATGREWLRASAEATLARPPWQTVWAIADRRYDFGYVGPAPQDWASFFGDQNPYSVPMGTKGFLENVPKEVYDGNPTAYWRMVSRFARKLTFLHSAPNTGDRFWWIYGGGLAVLGLFYAATFAVLPPLLKPRRRLTFAAFSVFVMFLASKGWSPQFVAYLVPLLLIAFPPGEGGLWALLLTVTAFLETPIWSHYAFGRPGMTAWAEVILQIAVFARTAIFVAVIARLYPRLFRD